MRKLKMEMGKWFEWAIFDDGGNICGISEDAPEEEKRAYKQFVEDRNNLTKKGIKV